METLSLVFLFLLGLTFGTSGHVISHSTDTTTASSTTSSSYTANSSDTASSSNTASSSETVNSSDTANLSDTDNSSETANSSDTANLSDTDNSSETANSSDTANLSDTANSSKTANSSDTANISDTYNLSDMTNLSVTANTSDFANSSDTAIKSDTTDSSETANLSDTKNGSSSNIIYGSTLLAVSIFVVLGNGIVLFVIMKTDDLYVTTLAMIGHMAFWDLIQGLAVLVFITPSAFLGSFVYYESMISWVACFLSFLSGVGILNVVIIILDRLISLKWPMYHRKHTSTLKYAFIACCVYILAFTRTLLITYPEAEFSYINRIAICTISVKNYQGAIALIGPVVLSFLAIIFGSCIILRIISLRRRRVNSEQAVPFSINVTKRSIMCVLAAGVFCLSYLPIILRVIIASDNGVIDDIIYKFASVAYLSNSIWNVLIYSWNYKPFKAASLKLLCRSYYRRSNRRELLKTIKVRPGVSRIQVPKPIDLMRGHSSTTPLASVLNLPSVSI